MSFCLRLIIWFYLESSGQNSNDHMVASRRFSWWWIKDKMGGTRVRVCDCYVLRICIFTFHSSISNMKKKKWADTVADSFVIVEVYIVYKGKSTPMNANVIPWLLQPLNWKGDDMLCRCGVIAGIVHFVTVLPLVTSGNKKGSCLLFRLMCILSVYVLCFCVAFFFFFIKDKNVKTKSRWTD